MKIQKQFRHEARFMVQLRNKHGLSQVRIARLIDPSKVHYGQLISNVERNMSGLSLQNWIVLWASLKFPWSSLCEAMAEDQRDYALRFLNNQTGKVEHETKEDVGIIA